MSQSAWSSANGEETFEALHLLDTLQPLCVAISTSTGGGGMRVGIGHIDGYVVLQLPPPPKNDSPEVSNSSNPFALLEPVMIFPPRHSTVTDGNSTDDDDRSDEKKPNDLLRGAMYGIGTLALLGVSSIVAVAGGGPRPYAPAHEIHLLVDGAPLRKWTLSTPVRRMEFVGSHLAVHSVASVTVAALRPPFAVVEFPARPSPPADAPPPMALAAAHGAVAWAVPNAADSGVVQIAVTVAPRTEGNHGAGGGKKGPPSSGPTASMGERRSPPPSDPSASGGTLSDAPMPSSAVLSASSSSNGEESGGGGGGGGSHVRVGCRWTAHSHELAALAFSPDGSVLVTAGARGTLLRVWKASNGERLHEFRLASTPLDVRHVAMGGHGWVAAIGGSELFVAFVGGKDQQQSVVASDKASSWSLMTSLGLGSEWAISALPIPPVFIRGTSPADASTGGGAGSTWTSLGSWNPLAWVGSSSSRTTSAPSSMPLHLGEGVCIWWESESLQVSAAAAAAMSEVEKRRRRVDHISMVSREGRVMRARFDVSDGTLRRVV